MFVATAINFLLFSLNTGTQIAAFIVAIRKGIILDIDFPLPEKLPVVNNAIRKLYTVIDWSGNIPVSINLSLPVPGFRFNFNNARQRY